MKKCSGLLIVALVLAATVISNISCKKSHNPIKFPLGTFPDSVYNLEGINSAFDDRNSTLYELNGSYPIIFSSNRGSNGGQYDLVQGLVWYKFDQTTGAFTLDSETTTDPFLSSLINKANTAGNDFGPLEVYSSSDGYNYLVLASQNAGGPLDLYYLKHLPRFNDNMPAIGGPYAVRVFNTGTDEAYLSFDENKDSVYFTSDRNGKYHIFCSKRPPSSNPDTWFNQPFEASAVVDSINYNGYNDICPYVIKNVMIFASDRPGGIGKYDLYYSVFKKGKWSSPVNLGPDINSDQNENRPVLERNADYTNWFLIFSSDKTGGLAKGGFDLYFTGFKIPE
jgi:hypothetical protein